MTKKSQNRPAPLNRDALRPVDKAFIHSVMFDIGIIPIEDPTLDMRVPLRQMTSEESRVAKRKFRKLWRKYMKQKIGKTNPISHDAQTNIVKNRLGVGKHAPSRQERKERKRLVYGKVWDDVIAPMLVEFENPERKKQDDVVEPGITE